VSTRELYPEEKHLGCEAICSVPHNAKVKSVWGYTSSPICLLGMHRENFIYMNFSLHGANMDFKNKRG
jgi:hypothetical protein